MTFERVSLNMGLVSVLPCKLKLSQPVFLGNDISCKDYESTVRSGQLSQVSSQPGRNSIFHSSAEFACPEIHHLYIRAAKTPLSQFCTIHLLFFFLTLSWARPARHATSFRADRGRTLITPFSRRLVSFRVAQGTRGSMMDGI